MRTHEVRRRLAKRDETGLTTLEWLLIVGAVAALAALAVVLVYYFVEDTGDRFSAPIPRLTAARLQAVEVVKEAKSAAADDFDTWDDWQRHFSGRCARIEITIGDERIEVRSNFERPTDASASTAFDAAVALTADSMPPRRGKAQADCAAQ